MNEYAVFYLLLMLMCLSRSMLTVLLSGFDTCFQIKSPDFYVNHTITIPQTPDLSTYYYTYMEREKTNKYLQGLTKSSLDLFGLISPPNATKAETPLRFSDAFFSVGKPNLPR